MTANQETGKSGEQIAAAYLSSKGYEILETNWHHGALEIDIIARKENVLVIGEVKTRKSTYFGEPEEFVTRAKQKNLIRAANLYIIEKDLDYEVRFDILSVVFNGENHKLHHIEDAFYPTL